MAQSAYHQKEKHEWLDRIGEIYEEILRKKGVRFHKRSGGFRKRSDPGRHETGERDRRDPKQISGRSFWKILKKIQKNICCPAFETLLTPDPPAYNERDMKKGGERCV